MAEANPPTIKVPTLPNPDGWTQEQRDAQIRQLRIIQAKRAAAEKDILAWGAALFPDKFSLPFCRPLHQYLVDIRHEPRVALEAPRGHSKTTIQCFLIPMFMALEESERYEFYLNVQATEDKALAANVSIRDEFDENELLREMYGDMRGTRWADSLFVLKNKIAFGAISTGQKIRGLQYHSRRPDYINADDFYDEEDINNIENTKKKNRWIWGSLYPARSKTRPSCFHIQGTAMNEVDVLNTLKKDKRFKQRTFKAVLDWEKGIMLWPEAYNFADIGEDLKTMSRAIFEREYQNERFDLSNSIIERAWIESPSWEYDPNTFLKFDVGFILLSVIITCDPSIGKKKENDPTGFAVILKCQRMDGSLPIYCIDALRNDHLSLQERIDHLKTWTEQYTNRFPNMTSLELRIETISGFKDFGDMVSQQIPVSCTMVDKVPDKITNLEKKSFLLQNHRVFINKNIEPTLKEELTHQILTNFPERDDIRDAVLLGLDVTDAGVL